MKLISLELQNFRQHLNTEIAFSDGVTGIVGPNGAGKTTILEAIAWALYGSLAVRGTNDTIRSSASEGGAKVSVALTFELGGAVYRAARSLDGSGRAGHAVLEVDGKPLRSGVSEVNTGIAGLLGMDYQAFFTSFFTGQKQLEFMSQLEGRERAVAISRMLGYDRLTKARDRANDDRKGLQREIEGLEKALPDPEELKQRKKDAEAALASAGKSLKDVEKTRKASSEVVARLKPLKEASDQKAKLHDELTPRLEVDRAELARLKSRLSELNDEVRDLSAKRKKLDSLAPDLRKFEEASEEYKKLAQLQRHEGERQRLSGRIASLEQDIKKLAARQRQLERAGDEQTKLAAALGEAENLLAKADEDIRAMRENQIAYQHGLDAQIKQLEEQREEIRAKKAQIESAGPDGICPTCERPLADELPKVLAGFDSQVRRISRQITSLNDKKSKSDTSKIDSAQTDRGQLAAQIEELRAEKAKADTLVVEYANARQEIDSRTKQLHELRAEQEKLPSGFDQTRYAELRKLGEDLRPVRDKSIALKSALDREPQVRNEIDRSTALSESKSKAVSESERALSELAFSPDDHEKLTGEFETAAADLNAALVLLERQRGEVNTASAVLKQIEREEESYKSRIEELRRKRSERLHLAVLAEAFDKLRTDLNDRIRPELESTASELLSVMTDGRYNILEITENYQATVRDDGELKPVISGGENDIVNLALRLAVSQMIADRAGQSFSLLVLDEVFGSLDDARRDNVVSLLQNLKNRFEQIILITHIESIHDAVDNCLWVEFDERTKTSRLTERSEQTEHPQVGAFV